MKQFLMKYLIGLGLIIGLIVTMSPSASASEHSCHIKKNKCSALMCLVKDCDIVCKAHCKHD